MDETDPWLIEFWTLAGVSMLIMIVVIMYIYKFGRFNDLKTSLLFVLYLTVLIEEISYLPGAYNGNLGLCKFMGWLHYYSGFVNVLVIFLMSCHYFSVICGERYQDFITDFIANYGFKFAAIFPLITLFPFLTDSYDETRGIWCSLPGDNEISNTWAYTIFYVWVILFLFIANLQFFYSIYRLWRVELNMRKRLFYSIGIYILISTYAWIPRILMRIFDFNVQGSYNIANLITTAQLYVSGLFYGLVFSLTDPIHGLPVVQSDAKFHVDTFDIDLLSEALDGGDNEDDENGDEIEETLLRSSAAGGSSRI